MNIIVCVKQVLDPQIPPAKFRIDPQAKRVIPSDGIPTVINPYDAQAVELAIRFKSKYGGRITILTVGNEEAVDVIRRALSMGADEGILLNDVAFESSDSFSSAYILTKAIEKVGDYNLILCGRQAADWDEGLVGSIIAENLVIPLVTLAEAIDLVDNELIVKRVILDGYQLFAVGMPALITVSNEVGQPRLPSGWGIISAARKQIPIWNANDINADPSRIGVNATRKRLLQLFIPERERKCEIVGGETIAQAAIRLADRLREIGRI